MGLNFEEAARGLGVRRKALSELLNGHSGVSPEMAIRLSKAFGGTPETTRPILRRLERCWSDAVRYADSPASEDEL